jgi:hypothetical protein
MNLIRNDSCFHAAFAAGRFFKIRATEQLKGEIASHDQVLAETPRDAGLCSAQASPQGLDVRAPRAASGAHSRLAALAPLDRPALRSGQGAIGDERAEARRPEPRAYPADASRAARVASRRAQHRDPAHTYPRHAAGARARRSTSDARDPLKAHGAARCSRETDEHSSTEPTGE